MKWKTTLVLLIVTVAVGAYVSRYELRRPTAEQRERLAQQVADIPPDTVRRVRIELPKTTVAIERAANSWQMTEPLRARAEASLVSQILAELNPLTAERTLTGTSLKPADYGLDPAQGTLTIEADGGTTVLRLGEHTAVGENRYIALPNQSKVFVVGPDLFELIEQPADAYRDHAILTLDAWQIDELIVQSPKSAYALTRQGDRWLLNEPVIDQADTAAVSGVLNKLKAVRADAFVSEQPTAEDLARFGLESPQIQIVVRGGADQPPQTLLIGELTTQTPPHRYAKRGEEPTVYSIPAAAIEALFVDPESLRSTLLFDLFASQITKVEVEWQAKTWAIEKSDDQWKVVESGAMLDNRQVDEWLWKLRELRVEKFLEDEPTDLAAYGLEPPQGRISLWVLDGEESKDVLIGKPIESGHTRYGQITGRPGLVELPEALETLLGAPPITPPAPAAADGAPEPAAP